MPSSILSPSASFAFLSLCPLVSMRESVRAAWTVESHCAMLMWLLPSSFGLCLPLCVQEQRLTDYWRWWGTPMSNRFSFFFPLVFLVLPGSSSSPRLWRQTVARRRRIANDASGRRAWSRVGCWRRKCQRPTEDRWPNRRTSSKTSTPSSGMKKKKNEKKWLKWLGFWQDTRFCYLHLLREFKK